MKLKQLYKSVIDIGIRNDPRGAAGVKRVLDERKKEFDQLDEKKKKAYDREKLVNPYDDTRVHVGEDDLEVTRVMVGIDMETPEIMLADRLSQTGKKIDLVMAHHPEGRAFAQFYRVMEMQADMFQQLGVPISVAESLTEERMAEVGRNVRAANHMRAVDAAQLLKMGFVNVHTPTDNCVQSFLSELCEKEKPVLVSDLIDLLNGVPEYETAAQNNNGPTILLGRGKMRAGKVFVDMTGGTGPSQEVYRELRDAGVSTVIGMHMSENSYKKAKEARLNVVIAGHISSDSLGINVLLDELLKKGSFDIVPASGFIRVSRQKKT